MSGSSPNFFYPHRKWSSCIRQPCCGGANDPIRIPQLSWFIASSSVRYARNASHCVQRVQCCIAMHITKQMREVENICDLLLVNTRSRVLQRTIDSLNAFAARVDRNPRCLQSKSSNLWNAVFILYPCPWLVRDSYLDTHKEAPRSLVF